MLSVTPIPDEAIAAWLESRELGHLEYTRLPNTGFVNWAYLVGDELVLRVNKPDVDDVDAYTEMVAVPLAVAAGVNTPELLLFDESKSILPTVATLYRRAPGVTLGRLRVDQRELPALYEEIGEQLAILHSGVKNCDDPNGWLDHPEITDAREQLDIARREMKVEAVSYDWIARWLDILEPAISPTVANAFLHDDLHSFNTVVFEQPLRLSAVLDWGDAGWGDPMIDFCTLPIWAVDWALRGYCRIAGPVDDHFIGRILWNDIALALDATIDPWVETPEPWQPLTTSRWINLIRLFSMELDSRWNRWLPA
jgi:aminoglycoside phosphotransferase (APT) family kinase protein